MNRQRDGRKGNPRWGSCPVQIDKELDRPLRALPRGSGRWGAGGWVTEPPLDGDAFFSFADGREDEWSRSSEHPC